ncbi:MAG: PQQ-like beta-propeller repeat protein [Alphaproteobacteria bacterium]|nr:PQQ-like beta-propeller repeat protein [Alphaproteobacteria bacterium]
MYKVLGIICGLLLLSACDKHDPILPGVRTPIFDTAEISVSNTEITEIPTDAVIINNSDCRYTQDASNVIWDGERRIFSGFPTKHTVSNTPRPICSGKYIYAGLTTGEVVKINPTTRELVWIADVYRASAMTGGSTMVDIVAPIVPHGKYVYAGGLGDAFCKLSAASGAKTWCLNIGVGLPFVVAGNYAFVVSTDDKLYAIELSSGTVKWRSVVEAALVPTYENGELLVGDERFSITDGKKIK